MSRGERPCSRACSRGCRAPRAGRLHAFVDREPGQPAGVADLCHRLAQHEVRLPGRVRQSVPDLPELHPGRSGPDEQRRAEPADADHLRAGRTPRHVRNLIPTNFYAQDQWTHKPADAAGRRAVRLLISNYPDQGIGGPGWPYAPVEIFFPSRSTPGYGGRTSRRGWAWPTTCSGTGRRRSGSTSASIWKPSRRATTIWT